jgi:hypothetical protein
MEQRLAGVVEEIVSTALQGGADEAARVAAIKDALDAHAEEGTFGPWGVLAREQLRRLQITVAYDPRARVFVANTAEIAAQIEKIGAFD